MMPLSSVRSAARAALAGSLLALLSLTPGCSSDSPSEPEPPSGPAALTVDPSSGPPTTIVTLGGLPPDFDAGTAQLRIGGHEAPILRARTGELLTAAPAVLDTATGWTLVTAGPVDVEVFVDGDLVARAERAFSIDELPAAPGTAGAVLAAFQRLPDALEGVLARYPVPPGEEDMIGVVAVGALEELVNGTDSRSLAQTIATVESDAPDQLELVDALLAQGGVDELLESLAAASEALAAIEPRSSLDRSGPTTLLDTELAEKMQLYEMVKLFGSTVIGPTANQFSLVMSVVGLAQGIPYASIVSAALTVCDFAVNKVYIATLPAKVTSFTAEAAADTIDIGADTDVTMHIVAANDPPPIGIQDLIGLVLAGLGAVPGANPTEVIDQMIDDMLNMLNFLVQQIRGGLASYSNAHPELNLDIDLDLMPSLSWEADIETPDLVILQSFSPTILTPITGELNWRSDGEHGEGRIYARANNGPEAIQLPPLPGFTYAGGAFGIDIPRVDTFSIWVKPELTVELTMPTVASEQPQPLQVRAGYRDLQGVVQYSPDIQVSLQTQGGTVATSSGSTDAGGNFETTVALADGAAQVTVDVDAIGDVSSTASTSGSSSSEFPDIIVVSQAELNMWSGVTSAGQVHIGPQGPLSDISSLAPLSQLTALTGRLIIRNTQLQSLQGLENLTSLPDLLIAGDNPQLTSLEGLHNVEEAGPITITALSLTSLDGLRKLHTALQIGIFDSAITSLEGLDALVELTHSLSIYRGGSMTSLSGLPNLTTLGGLYVTNLAGPASFAGFAPSLTSIGPAGIAGIRVRIASCHGLTSLMGFAATTINGDVEITSNQNLASFSGFGVTQFNGDLEVRTNCALDEQTLQNWLASITVTGDVDASHGCRVDGK